MLLFLFFGNGAYSQDSSRSTGPSESRNYFYRDAQGRLIVAGHLPLFFFASNEPSAHGARFIQDSIKQPSIHLKEGRNIFKNITAGSASGNRPVKNAQFEIWADGQSPQTKPALSGAPRFK
ncbi:MAG: hypothetical protein GF313_17110, partial [Caldithrix sp.]|nr:hypothetical protein [Caldithrix sp.]